jgi:hypothetical protein
MERMSRFPALSHGTPPFGILHRIVTYLGRRTGFLRGVTTTCHQMTRRSQGLPACHAKASAAVGEGLWGNLFSYASIAL